MCCSSISTLDRWGRLLSDGAAVFASNAQMLLAMVETQTTSCTFSVALRQARHLQRLRFQARIVVKRQAEVFNEKAVA